MAGKEPALSTTDTSSFDPRLGTIIKGGQVVVLFTDGRKQAIDSGYKIVPVTNREKLMEATHNAGTIEEGVCYLYMPDVRMLTMVPGRREKALSQKRAESQDLMAGSKLP